MFTLVTVTRNQRVALYVDGVFSRLLGPGRHTVYTGLTHVERVVYTVATAPQPVVAGDDLPPGIAGVSDILVAPAERVLAYVGGVFVALLGPGRYRHFDSAGELVLVRADLRDEPLPLADDDVLPAVAGVTEFAVGEGQAAVLTRLTQPVRLLAPGRYRVFSGSPYAVRVVPLALHTLELAPQDLLTRDQVPVRVKPGVSYRFVDPLRAVFESDHLNILHAAVHAALREVVAGRELDALVTDRDALSAELLALVAKKLPAVGLAVETAVVRDVILAGEVKDLFNRVTLARKEAEALSIKRREETAATRQLLNTAKLLQENPVLMRLKELEQIAEIAGKVERLTLVGSTDLVQSIALARHHE